MWIAITLFAAACQSFRTAYQNTLSREAGFLHATMARSLYGLPLVSVYLLGVWYAFGGTAFDNATRFFIAATVCALAQILATYFMLRVFHSGSFALGTLLAKTEAVLAALIGLPVLHHSLTMSGWAGVVLGVAGALIMSVQWRNLLKAHKDVSFMLGLASGLCFAITSVAASVASHAFSGPLIINAGVTLWYVLVLQSVILCSIQMIKSRDLLAPFRADIRLSSKVGVLSSLGSIGWFTGFALVNPALVKTLGQAEIIGTLYFSRRRFGERITPQQWLGGILIVISVILVTVRF
ncbi:MAG: multidrug transporter [Oceanospirillaceae bacterium]|nr:multidrug transporter [Oceanospirillaceae bacterium]MBT13045.1 multidrug transporter [Oceanospirillaceae bacterium]|tara:strand:+ start:37746 stop:38627 length:882 start_codon:yes stop_codon:yes gene_type:complete